jgi:hypothetical protein
VVGKDSVYAGFDQVVKVFLNRIFGELNASGETPNGQSSLMNPGY